MITSYHGHLARLNQVQVALRSFLKLGCLVYVRISYKVLAFTYEKDVTMKIYGPAATFDGVAEKIYV
jgi:hypothetical protein